MINNTEKENPIEIELRVLYKDLEKKEKIIFLLNVGLLVIGFFGLIIGVYIGINIG